MRLPILLFIGLLALPLGAQQLSLSGQIIDQDGLGLPGAHLSLQYPWGEVVQDQVSGTDGFFQFEEVEQGGYRLIVQFLGYRDLQQEVTLKSSALDLGTLTLSPAAVELDEVEVKEKIPLAVQKGDTTQYNAEAFKTLKNSTAEELVSKMPGVVVEDGKLQAQGEEVKEVLVDGRPFFGNDPKAALRNLPAEVIDKIQVFDQKSEQAQFTGFDDGETSKTINIITRSDKRNGQFGNAYAGIGYEEKYQSGGNMSLFDGNRRLSLIGQSNNINQQNFTTEDLLGVVSNSNRQRRGPRMGGGSGRRGSRSSGGSINDFLVEQAEGISQTHALGINYSDLWAAKWEVSASYFFNYSDNESAQISDRLFVDAEETQEQYREDYKANSQNQNHRFNARLEYTIDPANSIVLRPQLSWQGNEGQSSTFGQTLLTSDLLNQTNNLYQSNLSALSGSNSLLYRHRFDKERRTFSVKLRSAYEEQGGDSDLYAENLFPQQTTLADTLDQESLLDVKGWNHSANLTYTEPIGQKSMLMLNYRAAVDLEDAQKEVFDVEEGQEEQGVLNESLSNTFDNQYWTQQWSAGFNFRKGRQFMLITRLSFQWAKQENKQQFPQIQETDRRFINLLPFAMMRWRVSGQENFRLIYRSSTTAPSIEQLQNVVDNSNPLQLTLGNP
ncbi:MAG: carboxypeptidase-like regulatory domain-containing protein, partial [Bacteroidota bacterium]